MTLATLEHLLATPAALTAASDLAPTEATFLQSFEKLRKRFAPDLAKAALEQVILRTKAREKFPLAARMFFEREALEQATHHVLAEHRALRFKPFKTVLDLGCGLGADSLALHHAGCQVKAVERDPMRFRLAEANFAALGVTIPVLCADALVDQLPTANAIFCDPARRIDGKRLLDTDSTSPSPREVLARFPNIPASFKLAPGIARSDLARYDGETEFVSLNGELKECRLWLGDFASTSHRATVLPTGDTLAAREIVYERDITEPGEFLYLPDSAVIRAGLEPQLAQSLKAAFLDGTQPLLTSDTLTATPFATAYRFDALVTGSLTRLTAALRERRIGRVTWMNLGSPREVEIVRRAVKLAGSGHRTVILTKIGDAAASLIVERLG